MTNFDLELARELERVQKQTEALRLSLRATRYHCLCSELDTCAYHANISNYLLDAEQTLGDAIQALIEHRSR